ncbi:MAG: hypothetical protein QW175_07410 [Candidatus Bathyarchaeia archaeon]
MKRKVLQQLKECSCGDLVQVDWTDASIGKSLSGGLTGIDVPVISVGVFLGVLGERNKHIILGQNHFRYADGLYDIDYTAVPLSWAVKVIVLVKGFIPPEDVQQLVSSFLMGGRRPRRTKQQRVVNHG